MVLAGLLVAGGAACGDATNGTPDGVRYEGSFAVLESPSHGPELCANIDESLPPQCSGLPIRNWDWDEVDGEESRNGTTWGSWHVIVTYRDGVLTLTDPPTPPRNPVRRTSDLAPACEQPDVVDPRAGEAEWEALGRDGEPLQVDDLVTIWVTGSRPEPVDGGPLPALQDPPSDDFVANVIVRPGAGDAAVHAVRERYAGPLCVVERNLPLEIELRAVQSELFDQGARAAVGQVQSAAADPMRGAVVAQVWVVDDTAAAYARSRWGTRVILMPLLHRVQ